MVIMCPLPPCCWLPHLFTAYLPSRVYGQVEQGLDVNKAPVSCRFGKQLRGLYGWSSGDRMLKCHSCVVRHVRELDQHTSAKRCNDRPQIGGSARVIQLLVWLWIQHPSSPSGYGPSSTRNQNLTPHPATHQMGRYDIRGVVRSQGTTNPFHASLSPHSSLFCMSTH